MSSAISNKQPLPVPTPPSQPTLSPEAVAKWDLGVSLILHSWSVLTDAVAAQWGGPDSSDKRDWLCGAIADMFTEREETDEYDTESVLVQVMGDEFDLDLEDDSAWGIAQKIASLRKEILEGNFSTVDEYHAKFLAKPRNQIPVAPHVAEITDEASSTEGDGSDEEMSEAPTMVSVQPRQVLEPVIDEDGFELVQKRGKRKP